MWKHQLGTAVHVCYMVNRGRTLVVRAAAILPHHKVELLKSLMWPLQMKGACLRVFSLTLTSTGASANWAKHGAKHLSCVAGNG